MSQIARYIAVFGGSMAFLLLVAVGLAYLRPELFRTPGPTPAPPVTADSLRAPAAEQPAERATVPGETTATRSTEPVPDPPADSTSRLWKELQSRRIEVQTLTAQLQAERRQVDSLRTVRQTAAKLLNAMNAEDAAKILGNVTDEEARDILLMISTRHAGKILSALDPGRAATILR